MESPAKEILQQFEAAWGETRFIAGINAGEERNIEIPLKFIGSGTHVIEIFEDKPGEEMTDISRRLENIASASVLIINMMTNGSFCSLVMGN